MKITKWIASHKIFFIAPLLILITATVFAFANKWSEDRKTNLTAVQSYPDPTIKTASSVSHAGVAPSIPAVAPLRRTRGRTDGGSLGGEL